MKKLLTTLFVTLLLVTLTACGSKETADSTTPENDSAVAAVKAKGKLIVGITDFEPMDYQDANGEWIGFDADMAKAFAASLKVEAEFIEIDWDNKIFEVDSGAIDCIWNGMTLTEEMTASTSCSNPYSNNSQVVVVKDAAKFTSMADLAGATVAVEAGSAGSEELDATGVEVTKTELLTQANALMEVAGGYADACVIDYAMAMAMTGEGTSYADLAVVDSLNSELYGVAFKKGSDLTAALNDFFKAAYEDGTMMTIATTYGIQDTIVAQ